MPEGPTSQNTPQNTRQEQPWTHTWWGMSLLVGLIAIMLLIAFFARSTVDYYQQIQSGTVDLSAFAAASAISQIDENENAGGTVETINNARVNDFTSDPTFGPEDAALTIVLFEDFQCPYCAQLYPDIRATMNKYSDRVRFVYRDFPVTSIHPQAQLAAEAGQCAHEQGKFWEYHDILFSNQQRLSEADLKQYAANVNVDTRLFDACLDSGKYTNEVEQDFQDGLSAGVLGTPTLFFNGNKVQGVLTLEGLEQIIDYFFSGEIPQS